MSSAAPQSTSANPSSASLFFEALSVDDALPIDAEAKRLWLEDMQMPLRSAVLPVLRLVFSTMLFSTYFFKRLLPLQFEAPRLLQWQICWFMKYFVRPEVNVLILRHFAVESNILNFLVDNAPPEQAPLQPISLYPKMIRDLMDATLVDHDQELFRSMRDLGAMTPRHWPIPAAQLKWTHFRDVQIDYDASHRKWTQILDFETAHVLFMTLFCFLLKARDYEAAINGFQLDQSIAIRIAKMLDDPLLIDLSYNKYPLSLVNPWNLTQRFFLHGLFTEHMHERLLQARAASAQAS